MHYEEQTFNIPELEGISQEQIDVHLKLYSGYVANTNYLLDKITELSEDLENNKILVDELQRRLGFEFDGMRLHEYYFEQLEHGAQEPNQDSAFVQALTEQFGSFEEWLKDFKRVSGLRGIGWTMTYYDPKTGYFHNSWVSDHELGHLAGLPVVFNMDMWEHAFMVDYLPSEKAQYKDAYIGNVNWSVVEERFDQIS
ncbi:MAG: superoxide dismutase [Candidatus Paceibacteria bacterium]